MLAAIALAFSNVSAQTAKWIDNVKLSGYGIAQYQFTNQDKAKSNSFNLRLGRVSLDGRLLTIGHGKYKSSLMAIHLL